MKAAKSLVLMALVSVLPANQVLASDRCEQAAKDELTLAEQIDSKFHLEPLTIECDLSLVSCQVKTRQFVQRVERLIERTDPDGESNNGLMMATDVICDTQLVPLTKEVVEMYRHLLDRMKVKFSEYL